MKKMKRLLLCRNSGGFTLAEVIISCALLGILLIGIGLFISPILSIVSDTNSSTRASNLATTVEYYISRSVRNAAFIAVYSEAEFSDTTTNSNITTDVNEMKSFVSANSSYSLKCISIRYAYDELSGTNKYFICNEKVKSDGTLDAVNSNSNALSQDCLVFDTCYFDDLYLGINIEQETDAADSTKLLPAIRVDISVYDDAAMDQNSLVFFGQGYTTLRNIELAQNDASLQSKYKIIGSLPTSLGTGKDTYIYYVERTLATT